MRTTNSVIRSAGDRHSMSSSVATSAQVPPAERIASTFRELQSSKAGLQSVEAQARLGRYGANAIADRTESAWHKLTAYFWGPLPLSDRSRGGHLRGPPGLA